MTKILFLALLFLSCNSAKNGIPPLEKTEKVEFLISDKKIAVKDNFKIFFLIGQDSILPHVKEDSMIYNNKFFDKTGLLTIGFRFENYSVTIDRLPGYLFSQNQHCTFQFGLTSASRFGTPSNFQNDGRYRFKYLSVNPRDSGIARYFERPYVEKISVNDINAIKNKTENSLK